MLVSCIEEDQPGQELQFDTDMDEELFSDSKILKRSELLKVTGECIHHLKKKATAGRFSDQDLEKMRDSKMRLLLESCKVHAAILKDEELSEIEKRLVDIESAMKVRVSE